MADTVPGIYRKLAKIMDAVKRIPKHGINPRFNYKFAQESDVADCVREAMVEQGVAFGAVISGPPETTDVTTSGGGKQLLTRVPLRLTYTDIDDGSSVTQDWWGEGMDTQDKSIAKAATSGTKYGLLKQFLIPTCDDPGADADAPAQGQRYVPPRQATSAQQTTANKPSAQGPQQSSAPPDRSDAKTWSRFWPSLKQHGVSQDQYKAYLAATFKDAAGKEVTSSKDLTEADWTYVWRLVTEGTTDAVKLSMLRGPAA